MIEIFRNLFVSLILFLRPLEVESREKRVEWFCWIVAIVGWGFLIYMWMRG